MAMFDSIIAEADRKFNLSGKAGTLLSALLALMTDRNGGGLAGFLQKFERAGLGETAASWTNTGANTQVSSEQLESALGADALKQIANQAGTDYETATSAAAFMTPRIVDALTPDGMIPLEGDLLSTIGGSLTGAAAASAFDRVDAGTTDTMNADRRIVGDKFDTATEPQAVGARANDNLNRVDNDFNDDSPLKWIMPLALLFLLLVIGYSFCGKSPEPAKPANANVSAGNATTNANVANN